MRLVLIPAVLAMAAATGAATQSDDRVPAATPDGKAQTCVSLRSIKETRVHGDRVIDFHMRGGQVLRNTLDHDCPSLGVQERFTYRVSTSQLCSTDFITVLESPGLSQGASCNLSEFQPVKLVEDGHKGH